MIYGQKSTIANKKNQKEVQKLGAQKAVKETFKVIDDIEKETAHDLINLTEIPAPPFKEMERATCFKKLLEKTGVSKVWIDDEGNVLALLLTLAETEISIKHS